MSVMDFLEYLVSYPQTRELASELADLWAEHEVLGALEPAA